jgi:hypothetical protein
MQGTREEKARIENARTLPPSTSALTALTHTHVEFSSLNVMYKPIYYSNIGAGEECAIHL